MLELSTSYCINKPINFKQSTKHIPLPQHQLFLLVMMFTFSSVVASLKKFRDEAFKCAICLEPCTGDTLINPECNHRFCGKCIKESLNKCNHKCPTCRVHISTYRTCRRDPQFDHIVSSGVCIYHDSDRLQYITNGHLLLCSA